MRKIRSKARAIAGSQEWGTANTGTEQVGFRVQLIGGDMDGQSFTWYGYFTDTSEERTLESLRIAGWDGDFGALLDLPGLGSTEFELQLEDQADKDGKLVINPETGEPYLKPTFINRIGVAMKNVMDANEKTAFAARMRARYGGGAPPRTRTPPRNSGGRSGGPDMSAPPPTDDDINF
jgi:hypothetical protein